MADIDRLQIEIESSSSQAAQQVKALNEQLMALKSTLGGSWRNPLKDVVSAVKGTRQAADGGRSTAEQRVQNQTTQIQNLGKSIDAAKVVKDLDRIDKQIEITSDKMLKLQMQLENMEIAKNINGTAASKALFDQSEYDSLKAKLNELQTFIDAMDAQRKSTLGQLNPQIDAKDVIKASAEVEQLKEKSEDLNRRSIKLKVDASEIDKAEKKVSKLHDLFASLKRIAMYRLLRSAIKLVTDAIKEGLENAYEYSKAFGGDLAPALDRISSAWAQLKNQLGAAFGQALIALEPVIVTLIQLVTKLAQAFTWLFAVLSGSDKYLVANDIATSWGKAEKAAGSYRKMLLGIDEINRMDSGSGGGGGAGNIGDLFRWEPTNFKLPDLTGWISPLNEKIKGGIDKVKEFIRELLNIPEEVPVTIGVITSTALQKIGELVTELAAIPALVLVTISALTATALEKIGGLLEKIRLLKEPVTVEVKSEVSSPIPVLTKIRESLDSIVEKSPYIYAIRSIIPSPLPTLALITNAISLLLGSSPYIYTVDSEIVDPSLQLAEIKGKIETFLDETQLKLETWKYDIIEIFKNAWEFAETTVSSKASNAKREIFTFVDETSKKVETWKTDFVNYCKEAMEFVEQTTSEKTANAKKSITTFVEETTLKIEGWKNDVITYFSEALNETQTKIDTFLEHARTIFSIIWGEIKDDTDDDINNIKGNIETLTTETIPKLEEWGEDVAAIAASAFFGFALGAYEGLSSAADNIVSFANGAASTIHTWATGTLSNFASWANGVLTTVDNALKSAWESFKSFMTATGETISGFWRENKSVIIPVAIGAAVTIGAIALAAPTGGLSLAALALAKGGIVDSPTLFYAGEAGKEAVIPLERNTEWINTVAAGLASRMEQSGASDSDAIETAADREISAIYEIANRIIRAIEDKDTTVRIDSRDITKAQNRYARAMGV